MDLNREFEKATGAREAFVDYVVNDKMMCYDYTITFCYSGRWWKSEMHVSDSVHRNPENLVKMFPMMFAFRRATY